MPCEQKLVEWSRPSAQTGRRVLIAAWSLTRGIVVTGAICATCPFREPRSTSGSSLAVGVVEAVDAVRGIFTEQVAGVAVPYARQLCRLGEIRILVGRALGGRPGQRLMNRLGMPTGRQTLLRHVTMAARGSGSGETIRVLGVDDWAWTKCQSFGTILVDLERGVVADLLPTRSADTDHVVGTTRGSDGGEP